MKSLIYQVSVGEPSKLYEFCIESVAAYCKRMGYDHIVQTEPELWITPDPKKSGRSREAVERLGYLPIFEKENAFKYLRHDFGGYDNIAIIDADVFIRPECEEDIFMELFDVTPVSHDTKGTVSLIKARDAFGGVVERSLPCSQQHKRKLTHYSRMQYGNLEGFNWRGGAADFINMGVMVFNKQMQLYDYDMQYPVDFLKREEFQPFINGEGHYKWSTDQTLLNFWLKKEKIPVKELDWKWNCLYTVVSDSDLKKANFVHFFLKDKLPNQGEDIAMLEKILR